MKYLSFITILLLFSINTKGQKKNPFSITISTFNESTAIPFTRFITFPFHPGVQIGTEIDYRSQKHSRLFQTCNASYFYHNYLTQGIGINTSLGYEYRLNIGLAFEALLGVGYEHTFATAKEFTFQNGHYQQKPDKGNASFAPSLTLGVGYYLKKEKESPKIFVRYESWAEYPYSPGFIPIMTHLNLHLGIKLLITKKEQKDV